MSVAPVLLWTDFLFYSLLLCLMISILKARKNKILVLKWQQIIKNPIRLLAVLTLGVFMVIACLDSIHFKAKTQTRVESVLDLILSPLGTQNETTYSAPFALYAYTPEVQKNEEGDLSFQYTRLKYAGSHLKQDADRNPDIMQRALKGVGFAIGLFLIWLGGCFIWRKKYSKVFLAWSFILLLVCSLVQQFKTGYHILGTDKVGQDVFLMSLKSIRTGILIGTLTTFIMLPFAVLLGTLSGFLGGWVDDLIQYSYTTLSSIPSVLLIAASILSLQLMVDQHAAIFDTMLERTDVRLLLLCIILGMTSWTSLCRLLRAETLKIRTLDYIQAARNLGVSRFKILIAHIIPNVFHVIVIATVLDFSSLVLTESVLSYIGVGVDPATFSWGNMINAARLEMAAEPVIWWSLLGAFSMMGILLLSANIFADGVRDVFDPKIP